MKEKLKNEYIPVLESSFPFEDGVEDVISPQGSVYADEDWARKLVILTTGKRYIKFLDILCTEQWQEDLDQTYYQYIKGLISILTTFKFCESIENTLQFARYILQKGKIVGTKQGSGRQEFTFCSHGYSWLH